MIAAMDLVRAGAALRAVRVARRERIRDVAVRSGLSSSTISRIERGDAVRASVASLEALAGALGASLDLAVRWRGADLDRLLNAAHSAMHERVAGIFAALPQWTALPEVSFSVFGERGVIDWLAWHPASGSLLVIELKTAVVDVQAVLGTIDRYERLASGIARERGWTARTVSVWLLFDDLPRNRRAVARHRMLFGRRFASSGHAMRSWLRRPGGSVRALSFLSNSHGVTVRPRRIRRRQDEGQAVERDDARRPAAASLASRHAITPRESDGSPRG